MHDAPILHHAHNRRHGSEISIQLHCWPQVVGMSFLLSGHQSSFYDCTNIWRSMDCGFLVTIFSFIMINMDNYTPWWQWRYCYIGGGVNVYIGVMQRPDILDALVTMLFTIMGPFLIVAMVKRIRRQGVRIQPRILFYIRKYDLYQVILI